MKRCLKAGVVPGVIGLLLAGCGIQAAHNPKAAAVQGDVVLRVYVVRHAQAYKNIPQPAGTPDEKLDSLTPKGLEQATAAGKFLSDREIVAVITSPMGRTRQTADAIGTAVELDEHYLEDSAFASLKNGETFEGKPTFWSWRKEQLKAGRDPRPVGGESFQDGVARTTGAINKLAEKYPGRAVAVVSHGDICAALLGQAERTSIYKRHQLHDVATGSVSEIVITSQGWYLPKQGVRPARQDFLIAPDCRQHNAGPAFGRLSG
ncbi:MAG: histidine phosphatase family protein [Planctomycetota bacterium]|jgi:broad specificity phosphatase PhoE